MTISILTRFPKNDSIDVARNTYIFIGAYNLEGLNADTLKVSIGETVVYENREFALPEYDGHVVLTNSYAAIKIQPRRYFPFSEKVEVTTRLSNIAVPPSEYLTDTFSFVTVPQLNTVVNQSVLAPSQIRLMKFFPRTYLEQLRQILVDGLSPKFQLAPLAAAYRLNLSLNKALIGPLILNLKDLLDVDLLPIDALDVSLQKYSMLWEPALKELQALGVGPATIGTLRRGLLSGYPQNRVGAICGAVLLGADFLQVAGL